MRQKRWTMSFAAFSVFGAKNMVRPLKSMPFLSICCIFPLQRKKEPFGSGFGGNIGSDWGGLATFPLLSRMKSLFSVFLHFG